MDGMVISSIHVGVFCCSYLQHGMSIGIGDTVADAATGAHIANIIDEAKNKVKGIIEEFQVCMSIVACHVTTTWANLHPRCLGPSASGGYSTLAGAVSIHTVASHATLAAVSTMQYGTKYGLQSS
mgnify:CR=1 FL=1